MPHVSRKSIWMLFGLLALCAAALVSQPASARESGLSGDLGGALQFPDQVEVQKIPQPAQLPEPGGWVTFTIAVENVSPLTVTLEGLVDSVYGPLPQAGGNCSVPQTLSPGSTYECAFSAQVVGGPGIYEDTVTIWGTDWQKNPVDAIAVATVTITGQPPDTGVGAPAAVVVGGAMAMGIGLFLAGGLLRRLTA
jgi:hypothetical protein